MNKKFKNILICTFQVIVTVFTENCFSQDSSSHDLHFQKLPASWDEGIPLGNGTLGALVWQKDSNLRVSLDRADLWDLRPVKEFSLPQFSFQWVKEQVDQELALQGQACNWKGRKVVKAAMAMRR